jgi:2-keto-4-pentenoate hydratase/2-oxohepta-3-ene-1,7-dioic acid hydratase in catechol pathway
MRQNPTDAKKKSLSGIYGLCNRPSPVTLVGMTPPRFLQPGDIVRCEIDGIGIIEDSVVD